MLYGKLLYWTTVTGVFRFRTELRCYHAVKQQRYCKTAEQIYQSSIVSRLYSAGQGKVNDNDRQLQIQHCFTYEMKLRSSSQEPQTVEIYMRSSW